MLKKLCFILAVIPFLLKAQSYPAKPSNYVTDDCRTLTQEEQQLLNNKLKSFEDSTGNQIFVYIAYSLNGENLEQLSQDIFHNWQIGQKNKNNGVLITIFIDDHKFRIQTGYGLEGNLPDLLTKRIQDENMRPRFKEGNYYQGISDGIDKLIYYSRHAFEPNEIQEAPEVTEMWQSWAIAYMANGILLIIYLFKLGKKRKGQPIALALFTILSVIIGVIPCIGAIVLFFMVMFISVIKGFSRSGSYSSYDSSDSSSWSSSDSSSSWSSSDSSSDFGGGGGGDSGGGGSSSDW